jgi:hypothetical protein
MEVAAALEDANNATSGVLWRGGVTIIINAVPPLAQDPYWLMVEMKALVDSPDLRRWWRCRMMHFKRNKSKQ